MAKIETIKTDITTLSVDAIVNAANSSLMGGGGVDGAIHKAAGSELLEACRKIRENEFPEGLPTGEAVITLGFNLPAKYVIHTVGPIWNDGNSRESELLELCYKNCLLLAEANQIKSIAFPAISTGVYGFPRDLASKIAREACEEHMLEAPGVDRIVLVEYGD